MQDRAGRYRCVSLRWKPEMMTAVLVAKNRRMKKDEWGRSKENTRTSLNHDNNFLSKLHCKDCIAGHWGDCVPAEQIFYSALLQETKWPNRRWEWVEMEITISSSFCQETRNAISSSSLWQTAGSWVLPLLPEHSGEHFLHSPALPACLEEQTCKVRSPLETFALVLVLFLLTHVQK